jgi:hypothetical protein
MWVGALGCMGEATNAHKVTAGKLEGKTTLERPRHRWEDNINMFPK